MGRKHGGWRFRGITRDAKLLGVSHQWLRLVLTGRGVSAPLLKRYNILKARQSVGDKSPSIAQT